MKTQACFTAQTQHNNSTRVVTLRQRCINAKFYHIDQYKQGQISFRKSFTYLDRKNHGPFKLLCIIRYVLMNYASKSKLKLPFSYIFWNSVKSIWTIYQLRLGKINGLWFIIWKQCYGYKIGQTLQFGLYLRASRLLKKR